MNILKNRKALAAIAIGMGAALTSPAALAQDGCGLTQDEIVSATQSALAPGSGLLTGSSGRVASAARGVASGNAGCSLDVVVALGNIRPDAAVDIAQAVADVTPGQRANLLAAAEQAEQTAQPGAGRVTGAATFDSDRYNDDRSNQDNPFSPS